MKTLEQWLVEYGDSHRHRQNQLIHKICVPLIFFSVVGLLLQIPLYVGRIQVGEILILAALAWYATLGIRALAVMILQLGISYIVIYMLSHITDPVVPLLIVFVLAWIGQFIGHQIEGKKPSFFKDLQFLLIGPLWVFEPFFKKS